MAAQLINKVAIVTGSSSGIGQAIAIKFASQGAKVTLCGRDQAKLKSALEKTVKASGGHSDRFHKVQGELNDQSVRKAVVAKTVEKFGRLDILVANAGTWLPRDTISELDEATFDAVINANLKSVFFLIQQAVPHLEKTRDLGVKGIRVNVISPGYIVTPLYRKKGAGFDDLTEAVRKLEASKTSLKEKELTAEDVAETAAFLASDAAGFITGENIRVDGGRTYGGTVTLGD